jgi:hypothetical protein
MVVRDRRCAENTTSRSLVLLPHVIARQLVLSPRHRPPQTLLGIGYDAQRHKRSASGKSIASAPPAIGLRQR